VRTSSRSRSFHTFLHFSSLLVPYWFPIVWLTHSLRFSLFFLQLGENVHAISDLLDAASDADLLVFVTPHQYIPSVLTTLKGNIKPTAKAISLVKGMEITPDGFNLISKVIERELGVTCSVLMGANIAQEIAEGETRGRRRGVAGSEEGKGEPVGWRFFSSLLV